MAVGRFFVKGQPPPGTEPGSVARTTPTCEPTQAFIGSAWSWDVSYADFPADESWQLTYVLRGPYDLTLAWGTEVTAASSGPGFEIRVPKATTDNITAHGAYRLVGRVSKSGDEFDGTVVYNGHLLLLADPTTAVNAKSQARQMLEAIDAALLDGVSDSTEIKSLSVNSRTVTYRDQVELEARRSHYAILVALEDNPGATVTHAIEFAHE